MEQERILPEEEVTDIADFFKVFGDPTRLRILFLLDAGEANVNTISSNLGISPSVASQHLKLLRAKFTGKTVLRSQAPEIKRSFPT